MYGVSDGSVRDRHLKDDSEHQETARYHPFRPQSLQRQLGNLRWRDFHPLEHQLASLHYPGALQLGSKQETGEIAGNKGKQRVAQDFITLDMTADGTKRIKFFVLDAYSFRGAEFASPLRRALPSSAHPPEVWSQEDHRKVTCLGHPVGVQNRHENRFEGPG